MESRSVLVESEIHYPGWSVRVNGHKGNLPEADYALMGVGLDRGFHDVEFLFQPDTVWLGIRVSVLAMIGLAGFVMWNHRAISVSVGKKSLAVNEKRKVLVFSVGMFVIAFIVVAYLGLQFGGVQQHRFADRVQMSVLPTTVIAGTGSYSIFFKGLKDVNIPIRYSLNGGRTEVFTVYLDPYGTDGSVHFEVPSGTARGAYHFTEFKLPGINEWVNADASITVR